MVAVIVVRAFCDMTMGWNKSNVCLIGKTAIITGGRTGMGFQTALMLASRGAKVILADRKDSTDSRMAIIKATKNPYIISKFVDLTDLASIRRFAEEINNNEERLDILINNAGVAGSIHGYTKDGLQVQMQTNHLGPFLLTHLLVDLLKKSAPSRIIFVSSSSAYTDFLTLDALTTDPRDKIPYWDNYVHYSNTKLCNAISAMGFADRLRGTGVTCNALHPGIVTTALVASVMGVQHSHFGQQFWYTLASIIAKSPYEGAQTHAYLAMADEVKNLTGKFFVDCKVFFPPPAVRKKTFCEEIWKKSEELIGLKPSEKIFHVS